MSNASTLEQMDAAAQYEPEGVARATRFLKQYAPWFEQQNDGLTRSVTSPLSTTVTAVKASAGNLYAVYIKSGASATQDAYVQLFNVASGSVTLGTTAPDMVLKVPATEAAVYLAVPGDDDNNLFDTAISIAATTTHDGNTALNSASQPTVWVLYA